MMELCPAVTKAREAREEAHAAIQQEVASRQQALAAAASDSAAAGSEAQPAPIEDTDGGDMMTDEARQLMTRLAA